MHEGWEKGVFRMPDNISVLNKKDGKYIDPQQQLLSKIFHRKLILLPKQFCSFHLVKSNEVPVHP